MATLLKYSVVKSSDFTKLLFTDSTGVKPGTSDGYGAPDIVINDVTSVTVGIIFPDTTLMVVSPNLTNTVLTTTFDLTPDMYDGATFIDGYYQLRFTVTDGTTTLVVDKSFFITDETDCCVTKMNVNAILKTDCFTKEDLKPRIADMYLSSAKAAFFKCDLKTKATSFLKRASELCIDCGCSCN